MRKASHLKLLIVIFVLSAEYDVMCLNAYVCITRARVRTHTHTHTVTQLLRNKIIEDKCIKDRFNTVMFFYNLITTVYNLFIKIKSIFVDNELIQKIYCK